MSDDMRLMTCLHICLIIFVGCWLLLLLAISGGCFNLLVVAAACD